MKKYYIILTLIFVAGCGSDSVSEHKKESALEKKSVVKIEADKNVVKAKEPKSRKIKQILLNLWIRLRRLTFYYPI